MAGSKRKATVAVLVGLAIVAFGIYLLTGKEEKAYKGHICYKLHNTI